MELEIKTAQLYKTISQNLRDADWLSYVSFSVNFPLYILERVAKYLIKNNLVENYFEQSDFDKLQLDRTILLEIGNLIDSNIEQLSDVKLRKFCKKFKFNKLLSIKSFEWSSGWTKRQFDDYFKLINLIVDIVNPSPNQTIYKPDCHVGSTFIRLNREFPDYNLNFIGQVSPLGNHSFVCKANLFANGLEKVSSIYSEYPLDLSINQTKTKADIAIATNYLHESIYHRKENDISQFESSEEIRTFEVAYIELMLLMTKDNGKVIAVVPDNFLVNDENNFFRKKYLENDLVERIISLTKNAASIIILNKEKLFQNKGFVIFDGKDDDRLEETKVSIDEILSTNNYDWRAVRYALKEIKEVTSILSKYPQNEVKKIKDLVEFSTSGHYYSNIDNTVGSSSELLPYVRVSDLVQNENEFDLNISKIKRKISQEKVLTSTIIDFSAVLVSTFALNLNRTYFEFTGQPIIIGSDIIALKMKEDVNVEHFLLQLHSRLVQTQVKAMSSGATINRITKEDFLNIKIILPSLEEQQRQILEMRGVIEERAIAQEKIAKAEEQIEAIEYEVIANMNHSLKNKLGVIINDYDTLVRFLQRKERTNSAVSFNDTIRPVFEGENVADVDTIKLITERLKNNLLDTSKVFNTSLKLQTRELNKTPVELVSYFRNELKSLYAGQNFKIEIVAKPGLKINISIDKEVFKEAIDNLINNAKSHGFVEKDREYKIVFELSKTGEVFDEDSETVKNYARIIYKNDGKPFPKGFSFNDYVRYSSKAGKTQGTGIGGAVIDRIIKLHEGKFNEIPTDENSLFSVQFEILLSLDE